MNLLIWLYLYKPYLNCFWYEIMVSFSIILLKNIKSVLNPIKFWYKVILFISLILACSLSISFICENCVLLIIILIGNFLFFFIVFNVMDILYHLFSSIFPKFIWFWLIFLVLLLSLKKELNSFLCLFLISIYFHY